MTGLVIVAALVAFAAWLCVKASEAQAAARKKAEDDAERRG